MKIATVSAWNESYESIASLTVPNRKAYCEKHGYEFIGEKMTNELVSPQWGRMDVARKALRNYDIIFVLDIDAIITNMDICLEDLTTSDFVTTYDVNGFNCGVMLIRNTDWSLCFMDKYWEVGGRYQHYVNSDQVCLCHLLIAEPKEKWEVKPQRTMNSYPYEKYENFKFDEGNWQPNDFILHIPAIALERRIEIIKDKLGIKNVPTE